MIKKTPRQLPPLADMLRDMGATIHDASRALHVAPSTLYRWHNTGTPRAAALGLYWMAAYGQACYNDGQLLIGIVIAATGISLTATAMIR